MGIAIRLIMLALVLGVLGMVGCESKSREDASRVTQIVFLDQEVICPITKKSIDKVWNNVQEVAEKRNLQVTRVYRDTQGSLARKYTEFKPMTLPPGLYFVSGTGVTLDMLQGEKSVKDIEEVIEKYEPSTASPESSHNP